MWFKVSSFHNGKSSINKLIINLTEELKVLSEKKKRKSYIRQSMKLIVFIDENDQHKYNTFLWINILV